MTTQLITSAMPVSRPIRMKRGAGWKLTIRVKEDALTAKDTTGWTVQLRIKEAPNGEIYKTLAIGSGVTHTAAEGKFVFAQTAAEVEALEFARAVYDLIFTPASEEPICPFMGDVEVIQ